MEKKFKLRVIEMNPKTDEQMEKERNERSHENYARFNQNSPLPQEQAYNYLGVMEVELTQAEYDKLRHGLIAL